MKVRRTNDADFQFHPIFESAEDLTMCDVNMKRKMPRIMPRNPEETYALMDHALLVEYDSTFFLFHVHIDYIFIMQSRLREYI